MNLVEKAEKALEYIKHNESSTKIHELQAAVGTLGKCLAALGSRQIYARHYANLLQCAIPILLSLASHDSAEMRLAGDEALNRTVVGGLPFHCYKTNITLQNNVDPVKNARWNRAIFNRICLGETWLRPGMGRIRIQAQTLIPKLSIIVRHSEEIQLIVEALESNLPRILNCLADYTSDEEIMELCTALYNRAESSEAAVRRAVSQCVGHVCAHRLTLFTHILDTMYEKLWPHCSDNNTVLGWFSIIKAVLQINDVSKLDENNLFTVRNYMELYNLIMIYLEKSTTEHNIQNSVMECLSVLLSQSNGVYKQVLLDNHPMSIDLGNRHVHVQSNRVSRVWSDVNPSDDESDRSIAPTPALSCDDVSIRTPESPISDYEAPPTVDQVTRALERLSQFEIDYQHEQDTEMDEIGDTVVDSGDYEEQVEIGSLTDDDFPLKYCARLLVSKFLFSGRTGALVSDRSIRVSVKCQALSCLAEIVSIYPEAALLCIEVEHGHSDDKQDPSSNEDVVTRNLDMQFDHFSDATKEKPETTLSNPPQPTTQISKDQTTLYLISTKAVSHSDPLLQGRARTVIGRYVSNVLMEGVKWSDGNVLRTLVGCLVQGAQTPSPTCSVPSLQTLTNVLQALIYSQIDNTLVSTVLSELSTVESDPYWLVRVTLCTLYENIDYYRLFLVLPEYSIRSRLIMDTLYRLLADDDQRVRAAASKAIANIVPTIYPSKLESKHSIVNKLANQETEKYVINASTPSLDLMRNLHFFKDLPEQILYGKKLDNIDGLRSVVGEIMMFLMESSCRNFSFGLIECLHSICKVWLPWVHQDAYIDQGILDFMVGKLQYTYLPVGQRSLVNDICAMVYPVEIHALLSSVHQSASGTLPPLPFVGSLHNVVLKSLNVISHVAEELTVPPHTHLPGTPVRRPQNESRRSDDEKPRRRAQFVGNFYSDPIYLSLYDDLKATYSNFKVNLDQKSSIFFNFTQSVLNCLSIQLELCTEKEIGPLTEEILHYLRVIMTHCPNKSVFCVKQLLKCLFSTNIINHYKDYMTIAPCYKEDKHTIDYFKDILQVNNINEIPILTEENNRNSGQKLSLSTKNPKLVEERKLLQDMEDYSRNKIDKNWSTNKKELTRYIRMFEPAVIQALKSYTMQHDIALQCTVLALLDQLLTLRVNYCMLDSDQVFIGYVMKQLDFIEHHEIPDCDPLVTSILLFLLQLCSSKHHTKQIIELPKIIHVSECVVAGGCGVSSSGLCPLGLGVFLSPLPALQGNQRQEAMATREVTFNMLQKNMNHPRVIQAVTCVLAISQQHPEMYYRWSELACDTLLNLMMHDSIEYACKEDVQLVERLIESIYRDVILEQSRVEAALNILLKAAPDESASPIRRLRYLTNILLTATKIFPLIPEREIIMTIECVMVGTTSLASCFSSGTSWDPLFAEAVPLRAPVLLARILLKAMASSILLLNDTDMELAKVIAVNFVIAVKHIFHNHESSLFQTLASTAQSLIHDELNNLNTDSNPSESIPMDKLHSICLSKRHQIPLLTVHWAHLLARLKIFHDRFWIDLGGFSLNEETNNLSMRQTNPDMIQVGALLALCTKSNESVHKERAFLCAPGGSTLFGYSPPLLDSLLADRDFAINILNASMENMNFIQGELSLQVLSALSLMSEEVNEAIILFVCRLLDYLEPEVSKRFANLAVSKCRELSKSTDLGEGIQKAYDLFVQKQLYTVFPALYDSLRCLLPNAEGIQINETSIYEQSEEQCIIKYVKYRCSKSNLRRYLDSEYDLALYLTQLQKDTLLSIVNDQNFDLNLLNQIYRVIMKKYITDFTKIVYEFDKRETEKDNQRKEREIKPKLDNQIDNKITMSGIHVFKRSDSKDKEHNKSQFFIPITDRSIEEKNKEFQDIDIEHPSMPESWIIATNKLESFTQDFISKNHSISENENIFNSLLKAIDGLLSSLNKLTKFTSTVPVVTSRCLKDFLPQNLAKILANFLVVALQLVSEIVSKEGYSGVLIDLVLRVVSKSLQLNQVWCCLNEDECEGQRHIAVTSLYNILTFLLKNTKPLKLQEYLKTEGDNSNSDYVNSCNKLVTMIQFIENNSYRNKVVNSRLLTKCHNERLKQAVFCIGRCKSLWSVCMFPPCVWPTVSPSSDETYKSMFLPLDELKDSQVLEQYLFRVRSIGWSTRGSFEQTWVCAVGGGGHTAAPPPLLTPLPPTPHTHTHTLTTLTHVLVDLPRHTYSVPYYMDVTGISKAPDWRTRMFVRYVQDYIQVDLDSCVQLLLDLVAQAIEEQRDIPTCIRCLLWSFPALRSISHLTTISSLLPLSTPIPSLTLLKTLCDVLLAPQAVQGASLRDLTSMWAPIRIAALKSNLLLLENGRLNGEMTVAVKEHVLGVMNKQFGSLLEQELSWRFLLKLIESGDVDIINTAIQFVTMNPHHFCTETILQGINTLIQHNVLSKELKYTIIDRLMESIDKFNENDSLRTLILFMFSAVSGQSYFSGSSTPDADIDPELVIRGISGIQSGTKMLKSSFTVRTVIGEALHTLASNALPPPAVLSRIMNLISTPDKSYISISCYILAGLVKRAKNTDSLSAVVEWCLTTANLLPKELLLGVLALLCATSSNLTNFEDTVPLCIDLIRRSLSSDMSELSPDSDKKSGFKSLDDIEIEFLNTIVCESGLDKQYLEIIKELCVDNQYMQRLYKRLSDILG